MFPFRIALLFILSLAILGDSSRGGDDPKTKSKAPGKRPSMGSGRSAPSEKSNSAWEEYVANASQFSMPLSSSARPGAQRRVVGGREFTRAKDPRIAAALALQQEITKTRLLSDKLVAGVPIREQDLPLLFSKMKDLQREELALTKEIRDLVDVIKRSVVYDDSGSLSAMLKNLRSATVDQYKRESQAAAIEQVAHALALVSWKQLLPIVEAHGGPEHSQPLVKVEFQEIPSQRGGSSLILTNSSGRDLRQVTLRVRTNLSRTYTGAFSEFYLYWHAWKSGGTIHLDRVVVSKLQDTRQRSGFRDALTISLWSPEARQVDVRYHLLNGQPQITERPATPDKQIAAKLPKMRILTYGLTPDASGR